MEEARGGEKDEEQQSEGQRERERGESCSWSKVWTWSGWLKCDAEGSWTVDCEAERAQMLAWAGGQGGQARGEHGSEREGKLEEEKHKKRYIEVLGSSASSVNNWCLLRKAKLDGEGKWAVSWWRHLGGWLLCVTHPCFQLPIVPMYVCPYLPCLPT